MIRIGIISPSEIAFRRFMPALSLLSDNFKFVGIAYATPQEWFDNPAEVADDVIDNQQTVERNKAQQFIDNYGGKLYHGYESLIKSDDVDAVYIPLPPALHYKWAEKALTCRKHVFVEKPSTISLQDSKALVNKVFVIREEDYIIRILYHLHPQHLIHIVHHICKCEISKILT